MLSNLWQAFKNNSNLRYGVPMVLLVVGGSFGLREFSQIRYDAHKHTSKVDPAIADMIKNKEKTTLESEYEKIKDNRFEEWDNIRGPRPWEDSKSYQEQQKIKNNMKT
ncbi:cytochrome c oxidase assembly protein COX16 homolog, mitochondrial isoform X2 [Lithobates pipiens]